MKLLIRCNGPLRYLVQALSFARQLDAQGYQVYVECGSEKHSIFSCCPYAVALTREQSLPNGFKFDRVLSLEIGPRNVVEFRRSKLKWWQFWQSQHAELNATEWDNPFQMDLLPKPEPLMAQYGLVRAPSMQEAQSLFLKNEFNATLLFYPLLGDYRQQGHLGRLIGLIRDANTFASYNCGATIIADAVRDSYSHVIDQTNAGQDDFISPKQVRLKL